jgi:16S rRNA (guanine527-N7)-methyltransferase
MDLADFRYLLDAAGLLWDDEKDVSMERYLNLIREWNDFASLVSIGDLEKLHENHVIDALSLGGVVRRFCGDEGTLLDIGSGSGFPAIPLKVLMPGLHLTMVERNTKKVGFLRQVVAQLGLEHTHILLGEFPQMVVGQSFHLITARAVEQPVKILRAARPFIQSGSKFLCQAKAGLDQVPETFHVEQIVDEWTQLGLRRGTLTLISAN